MRLLKVIVILCLFLLPFRTLIYDISGYMKAEARTRNLTRFLELRERLFHPHQDEYESGRPIYDPYGIIRETYEPEQPQDPSGYGSPYYDTCFHEADYEPYHPDGFYDVDEDQVYTRR